MGSLTISQEDAIALLENLPDDLDPARKAVVETAVQLVGCVSYFWGGKSLTLGWDDRWGIPTSHRRRQRLHRRGATVWTGL